MMVAYLARYKSNTAHLLVLVCVGSGSLNTFDVGIIIGSSAGIDPNQTLKQRFYKMPLKLYDFVVISNPFKKNKVKVFLGMWW